METFTIEFYGHKNIRAMHKATLEVTKEDHLTLNGDCIVGVGATASVFDFPEWLKRGIREGKKIKFTIIVDDHGFSFFGYGSPLLSLEDQKELVIRKSDYISARTAAIRSSTSAIDLPRGIVKKLKDENTTGKLTIMIIQ